MKDVYIFKSLSKQDGFRGLIRIHKLKFTWEIVWKKYEIKNVAAGLHLGDRGSDTPVDIHFRLLGLIFFFGWAWPGLGAFCEKIGRGHQRDISIVTHHGQLWWKIWYFDQHGSDNYHECDRWRHPKLWPWSRGRKKARAWMCLRDGNIQLNPWSAFWGEPLYHYETIESHPNAIVSIGQFDNDQYLVDFKLEKVRRHRDHGPKWARRILEEDWAVHWFSRSGIPTQNHDWKGDNTYGSGFTIDTDKLWITEAKVKLRVWVRKQRESRNYKPPTVSE